MGAAFMAGYGYVEFAGPKEALFHAPDIRVGLLLLGRVCTIPRTRTRRRRSIIRSPRAGCGDVVRRTGEPFPPAARSIIRR